MKDIKKGLFIFTLNVFKHLLAFSIQILPYIELMFFIFILIFSLADRSHILRVRLMKSENVIEISLVDVDIFALCLCFLFLEELDIDFHAFLDAIMSDGPATSDTIAEFTFFDANNEVSTTLAHTLL